MSRPRWALLVMVLLMVGGTAFTWARTSAMNSSHDELIALGGRLFHDPRLSADGKTRCSSCHIPSKAYTDGRSVAIGVYGRTGTRNVPSLSILGRSGDTSFFWDGRRTTLERTVLDPFTNPVEMGLGSDQALVGKVMDDTSYEAAFAKAFATSATHVTIAHVAVALAAYVRSLDQSISTYDRYLSRHDLTVLNAQAQRGLVIFAGKGRCAECHLLQDQPTSLTDHSYHRSGVELTSITYDLPMLTRSVVERSLLNADLGNRIATHANEAQLGRFNVSLDPADISMFRTPSLRNVSSTAPYMHDGSVPTLDEAIDREVYYRSLQDGRPLNLSVTEKQELRAFLEAL